MLPGDGEKSLFLWRGKVNPVFIDLHIHTSNNPESLNLHYDVEELKRKVDELSVNSVSLISLTDHNTINTSTFSGTNNCSKITDISNLI